MPYRKITFQTGQVYHIYNRGVNRQPISFCQENWGYMKTVQALFPSRTG